MLLGPLDCFYIRPLTQWMVHKRTQRPSTVGLQNTDLGILDGEHIRVDLLESCLIMVYSIGNLSACSRLISRPRCGCMQHGTGSPPFRSRYEPRSELGHDFDFVWL